jgi:hypothetical protein
MRYSRARCSRRLETVTPVSYPQRAIRMNTEKKTIDSDDRFRAQEDVLSRTLDDEAVLLHLETGTYFGLNDVGSHVWDMLRARGSATFEELVTSTMETFDVSREVADEDLRRFLEGLLTKGLISRL